MILVTVGTQLPFDRLIRWMDAASAHLEEEIVAQCGEGGYRAQGFRTCGQLAPDMFERLVEQARVIVSHAGIGSIITAQKHGKPIILVARRATLKEHRNDHQQATVRALCGRPGIYVVDSEDELQGLLARDLTPLPAGSGGPGRDRLLASIATFVAGAPARSDIARDGHRQGLPTQEEAQ